MRPDSLNVVPHRRPSQLGRRGGGGLMEALEGGLNHLPWQELLSCEFQATPADAIYRICS
jgi:hypothetical protein